MLIPDDASGSAVLLRWADTSRWNMVGGAAQAFDLLNTQWSITSGRAFFRALQVCSGAGEGLFTPLEARLAFQDALDEAHIATQ